MEEIKCPECGHTITDDELEKALQYSHDTGFDECYQAAKDEPEDGR